MDQQFAAYFIVFEQRGPEESTLFLGVIPWIDMNIQRSYIFNSICFVIQYNIMDFTQILPKFVKQALDNVSNIKVLALTEANSVMTPE